MKDIYYLLVVILLIPIILAGCRKQNLYEQAMNNANADYSSDMLFEFNFNNMTYPNMAVIDEHTAAYITEDRAVYIRDFNCDEAEDIYNIVTEEAFLYLEGDYSIETVIFNIQNRCSTYIKEKN